MSKHSLLFNLLFLLIFNQAKTQESKTFKAHNGVRFEYRVVLPDDYNSKKPYELAMLFTQIEKEHEGYESTLATLSKGNQLKNTILFIPKVPLGNPHWISHPIHHGLNDLMDELRNEYGKRSQKFHFIGHLFGGRVAQTYSGMSSQYVASVSFINSKHWSITKQQYFDQIVDIGFPVYVYDEMAKGSLALDVSKTTFKKVNNFNEGLQLLDRKK